MVFMFSILLTILACVLIIHQPSESPYPSIAILPSTIFGSGMWASLNQVPDNFASDSLPASQSFYSDSLVATGEPVLSIPIGVRRDILSPFAADVITRLPDASSLTVCLSLLSISIFLSISLCVCVFFCH